MDTTSNMEINDEMIVRYLTGDADPEEAMAIATWLKSAENQALFERFAETWRSSGSAAAPSFSKSRAWQRLSASLDLQPRPIVNNNRRFRWWMAAAVSAVVIIIAGYVFVTDRIGTTIEPEMTRVETHREFRFLELSDRSTIALHRNTQIRYPDAFDKTRRLVFVDQGEAFFNVTTDSGRPFVVMANGVEITVIGTEFDVRLQGPDTHVHVREGTVQVSTRAEIREFTMGMTATVDGATGAITVSDRPAGNLYSYATQRLVFDDAPLGEVIVDLENAYPNTLELKNPSLKNCRITATFYKDDIDKIVTLIAETLNLKVSRDGAHFTLQGEGCL